MAEIVVYHTDTSKYMEPNPMGNNYISITDSSDDECYYQYRDSLFFHSENGSEYDIKHARHNVIYKLSPGEHTIKFSFIEPDVSDTFCNFFVDVQENMTAFVIIYNPNLKKKKDPVLCIFYSDKKDYVQFGSNEKFSNGELMYSAGVKKKSSKKEVQKPIESIEDLSQKPIESLKVPKLSDKLSAFADLFQDD